MTEPTFRLRLSEVRRAMGATPWAILPEKLDEILAVVALHAEGGHPAARTSDPFAARREAARGVGAGTVAVIPIYGTLVPRAGLMTDYSGGTSAEAIGQQIDAAAANPAVGTIVLDLDSGGGATSGIQEAAAKIRAARATTRVIAVCNGTTASAAYWLAAQAHEVVATPSAVVGSIGVYAVHTDTSEADAKAGVKHTVISFGAHKADGLTGPLSEAGTEALQALVTEHGEAFVADVAAGRGITPAQVRARYGDGKIFAAQSARAAGLVDRIATLEDVLGSLGVAAPRATTRAERAPALVADADPANATAPRHAVGDRVRALVDHDMGIQGRDGQVDEANAGAPPYYAVLFDGDQDPHRWLTEDEVEPAGASGAKERPAKKRAPMQMQHAAAAGMTLLALSPAAPLTPAVVEAPTAAVPLRLTPAPAARSHPVENENTAATGAATSQIDPVALERQRVREIRALGTEHAVDAAMVNAWIDNGAPVASVEREILAQHKARRQAAPSITVGTDRATQRPWASAGEFFAAVHSAHPQVSGGNMDVRLQAAAQGNNQAIGSEGGFLVPAQMSTAIWDRMSNAPDALLPRTDNYTVEGESLEFVANAETSRARGSLKGGLRAYWINEADQITKSKPTFRKVRVEPQQLGALVYVTEKLLRNSPVALDQYIGRGAAEAIDFEVGDALFRGDGAGKPKGILASGSLITVAKETSQAAATIKQENISKMWARLHPAARANAVWMINADVEPALDSLSTVVTNVAGTENVGGYANKVFDAERRTLKGRPVIVSEYCETLGTAGDIVLVDWSHYLTGTRGGVETAMSMHVRFEYAEMAFRFLFEADGQPWLASAQTPFKGANTQSTHIALATRS